jgi:hypothetical protein
MVTEQKGFGRPAGRDPVGKATILMPDIRLQIWLDLVDVKSASLRLS